MIGTKIGPWLITEEVGDGGHAFVFKGVKDDEVAAVKMLKPSVAGEENLEKRFKIEADALGSLRHPGIVGFIDYIYLRNFHYLVLEYMDAGAVDRVLKKSGPLEARYALPILYNILEGIIYAHSFGYIHRDIKPNNILLNKAGQAKLTDFGIAKVIGGENLTKQGFVVGTTQYLAPEYLSQGEINVQTDVYAIGVTLYEMLTARRPFEHDSSKEGILAFVKRVCLEDPPPPSTFRPIPESLERIVLRAMSRDTKKRYKSVDKIRSELRKEFPDLVERPIEIPDGRVQTRMISVGTPEERANQEQSGTSQRLMASVVNPTAVILSAIIMAAAVAVVGSTVLEWQAVTAAVGAVVTAAAIFALGLLSGRRARLQRQEAAHVPLPAGPEEEISESSVDALPPPQPDETIEAFEQTNLSELDAFLVCTIGGSKGKRWGLRPVSRMGRDLRYDIRPHDPEISRNHAMVRFDGVEFVIRDIGSTNGTYVNEKLVKGEQVLNEGDIVRVGRSSMRFEQGAPDLE